MKLSTFGMWEESRLALINNLLNDEQLKLDKQQLNDVLLGPVITKIIDTAFLCHQEFIQEQSPLSLKERTIASYKESLETMLPSLSESLGTDRSLLSSHVEKFVNEAMVFSNINIDYLMQLASISRQVKTAGINRLYGADFSNTYPLLAASLPLNDIQLMNDATKEITDAIHKNCPSNVRSAMLEHIQYMNEISEQKMSNPNFVNIFKTQTGMSMEQFKSQIRLMNYTGAAPASLVGHFKMRCELKETVKELPAITPALR